LHLKSSAFRSPSATGGSPMGTLPRHALQRRLGRAVQELLASVAPRADTSICRATRCSAALAAQEERRPLSRPRAGPAGRGPAGVCGPTRMGGSPLRQRIRRVDDVKMRKTLSPSKHSFIICRPKHRAKLSKSILRCNTATSGVSKGVPRLIC
jgi:hypothetical protein